MKRTRPGMLLAFGASAVMLAGCASSTQPARQAATTPTVGAQILPANTPLTTCVDPTPAKTKPVDTAIARDFAAGRIDRVLSLDDGAFRVEPAPRNVAPKISAAIAFCNLLAGATVENLSVIDAAGRNGLSFGLGVVTVADSVLKTTPKSYLVGGRQQTTSLQPYHRRLAWIAVIEPDIVAACPSNAPTARSAQKALPGYQILAIDADTGAAGIIYAAKTNALCNYPGYQPASVAPAVEFVSVAWTLVKRDPGAHSASITYQPRPCDSRDLGYFADTKQPAVFADRDNPARVNIVLERTLVTCGPATTVPLLLRSSD